MSCSNLSGSSVRYCRMLPMMVMAASFWLGKLLGFGLEQRLAHHLGERVNFVVIFGNIAVGGDLLHAGAGLLVEGQIAFIVVFFISIEKFFEGKRFSDGHHEVAAEVEVVGVVDVKRKHLQTELVVVQFFGGEGDTGETFLEGVHIVAMLVRGFGEDDEGAALAQHAGRAVVEDQVALNIAHIPVTAAEGGHDLEESQDAGHTILLEDVAARDEHGLPAVAEHGMQDSHRVHHAVLVVGNYDGGLSLCGNVFLIENVKVTVVDMVVHDAQIVHVEIVQPVVLVYVVKGNHTPLKNQIIRLQR